MQAVVEPDTEGYLVTLADASTIRLYRVTDGTVDLLAEVDLQVT